MKLSTKFFCLDNVSRETYSAVFLRLFLPVDNLCGYVDKNVDRFFAGNPLKNDRLIIVCVSFAIFKSHFFDYYYIL